MQSNPKREIVAKEVALVSGKSWASTIIYCAFTFPLFLFALFVIRDIGAILIFGLFAAFGVTSIVMTIRISESQQKFGELPLHLDDPLPTVGGRLSASLLLPASATRVAGILHASLVCMRVTYGEKQSRSEEPLRGIKMMIPVQRSATEGLVTFACEIPDDLPPADDPGLASAVRGKLYGAWELKVTATFEGVDLERNYAIDVGLGMALAKQRMPLAAAPAEATPQSSTVIERKLPPIITINPAAAVARSEPTAEQTEPDLSSVWVLVAVNLIPIAGVAFGGWRVHEIVFLYWIENLVIGAINILRVRIAVPNAMGSMAKRGVEPTGSELFRGKLILIGFFAAHYGGFCYGHGTFLASMFPVAEGGRQSNSLGSVLGDMLTDPYALIAISGIIVSHAYSYFHNYIGGGEYLHADVGSMMIRPYKRIFVTHFFIIVGGFAMLAMNSQLAAMIIFVALKIAFDVHFHRREREMSGWQKFR